MKRVGVARIGSDDPGMGPQQPVNQMQASTSMHTLQASQPIMATGAHMSVVSGGAAMLSLGGGFVRGVGAVGGVRSASPQVLNYLKPSTQAVPYNKQPQPMPKHKPLGGQSPSGAGSGLVAGAAAPAGQFQRLKVEDALSYLDQVKYKFSAHPQVYNDFLDIMKEFKSQSIDTPGVIARVSNLFKGHPELIVGFNTFLPPGYKIEVQSNGQVSVSMPSPTTLAGGPGVLLPGHQPPHQQLVHLLPTQPMQTGIVHNLSVPTAASNTLHHISQAHQQIEAAAAAAQHHASTGGVSSVAGAAHVAVANPGQPVEFNHAIEYVNKIKSRFSRQPDKYKRFLEILHAYQRGHRTGDHVREAKQQTEQEVYAQVAKLFENQNDLLAEFGQFLPDASSGKAAGTPPPAAVKHYQPPQQAMQIQPQQRPSVEGDVFPPAPQPAPHASPPPHPPHPQLTSKHPQPSAPPQTAQLPHAHLKRSPTYTSSSQIGVGAPPAKKSRCALMSGAAVRDVSYAEAAKYGTLADYSFFDRVRKALRSQETYDNFLRCLLLFTNEVISSSELVTITSPFLARHGELFKWFQDLLGPPPVEQSTTTEKNDAASGGYNSTHAIDVSVPEKDRIERPVVRYESIGTLGAQFRHDRAQGDAAMDIDLTTCKRLGTSYCALPRGSADSASRRCSGRTPLCREVLNDTWVSFPTWSEDSTFVTSRKTQFEESICRCEDERFELDVVIETNAATIRVLEGVQKKMSRMSGDELSKFRLDDCLGGTSPTIHQRALRRIYGEKVAVDIIAGLKKNPQVAIPVVIRRLKAKEEDWREAQKGFNKQWRETCEKYYLKSLDHQGINFKQSDLKALRSKSLFSDMESAYAAGRPGPHLTVDYGIRSRQEGIKILRDAAELLIHHARRQTAIQKAEKSRIKQLLRQFIPDLFDHPQQPPSDDERDDEEKEEGSGEGGSSPAQDENTSGPANRPDATPSLKQEKQEQSSESDTNTSDRGGGRTNRKDGKTNHTENGPGSKENNGKEVKRSDSSNGEDVKSEPTEEEDLKDAPPNEARFVCTSSWYLFLRLHGVLCARLAAARRAAAALAEQEARDTRTRAPSVALALRLKPANTVPPSEYYNALLELVRSVLDGNMESASYEDAVREMLGIRAYPAYTLDKVVSYAVRQLQHCVSEEWSVHACSLARAGMRAGGAAYVRRARRYLRREHAATLARVYGGDECCVTYELLSSDDQQSGESAEHAASRLAAWSLYSERYSRPDADEPATNKPVFLRRNVRRCGGGDGPARAATHADLAPAPHARRKPPKILDTSEATLAGRLRLVASRPHQLYRRGCLRGARDSHARLHEGRRSRFRAWHQSRVADKQ